MSKVSVIMPVYNGAKYIGEAIRGVYAQTYRDLELIVIDDGSTDDTESVVARLGFPLKFLKQENRGPSAARNLGLQSATGAYVVFLDADDIWEQSFLDVTVRQLDQLDDSVVGVCSGWLYTDQNGNTLSHTRVSRVGYLGLKDFLIANPFPIHAILARKSLLLSVDGFDPQILAMEDWDLWLRLMATGRQFYAVEPCLVRYRLHGKTNSHHPDRMRGGRLQALQKLFARDDLPSDIQLMKPRILGRALMQSSVELYAAKRDREAQNDFCEAIRTFPGLMEEHEIFYAVVCAQQPVGYKGTNRFLDLDAGELRLLDVIRMSIHVVGFSDTAFFKRGYNKAYLTLGRLAYGQRRMDSTRRYIFLALKYDPGCIVRSDALWLLGKSLIRPKWLDKLRGRKEHNFVKVD